MVAERLGIPFYDKEIIQKVAEKTGLSEETIEKEGEYSTTSILYNIATRGISGYNVAKNENMLLRDQINAYQTNYIKELAEQGPCVIVGRSADYILEDRNDCVHVFIYGDLEDRMRRVENEHGVSSKDSKKHEIRLKIFFEIIRKNVDDPRVSTIPSGEFQCCHVDLTPEIGIQHLVDSIYGNDNKEDIIISNMLLEKYQIGSKKSELQKLNARFE